MYTIRRGINAGAFLEAMRSRSHTHTQMQSHSVPIYNCKKKRNYFAFHIQWFDRVEFEQQTKHGCRARLNWGMLQIKICRWHWCLPSSCTSMSSQYPLLPVLFSPSLISKSKQHHPFHHTTPYYSLPHPFFNLTMAAPSVERTNANRMPAGSTKSITRGNYLMYLVYVATSSKQHWQNG